MALLALTIANMAGTPTIGILQWHQGRAFFGWSLKALCENVQKYKRANKECDL
jgi:hypothetical protein